MSNELAPTILQVARIMEALLNHPNPAVAFYVHNHLHSTENILGPWKTPNKTNTNAQGEKLVSGRSRLRGDPVVRVFEIRHPATKTRLFFGKTTYPWGVAAQGLRNRWIPGAPYVRERPEEYLTSTHQHLVDAQDEMDVYLVSIGVRVVHAPGPVLSPWVRESPPQPDHGRWVRTDDDDAVHAVIEGKPHPYTDSDGKVYRNVMHTWSPPFVDIDSYTLHQGEGPISSPDMTKKLCDRALARLGYRLPWPWGVLVARSAGRKGRRTPTMSTGAAEDLHAILTRTGLTIAAAESLTVGEVMRNLGSCSGSSAYFKGGVCAYTLELKVELLGVDGMHAAEVDCVSAEVARQMASGAREMFGADIGISTTGYAEPGTMPKHTMVNGSCIRCTCVDMVGGRSDECNYLPFAWFGFSIQDKHLEIRAEPFDDYLPATHQWDRDETQDELAMQALEKLFAWLPREIKP